MSWRVINFTPLLAFTALALMSLMPDRSEAAITQPSKIPQKEICSNGKIDLKQYLVWVFDNFKVSRKCVDLNGDKEETTSERKSTISNSEVDPQICSGVRAAQEITEELASQVSIKYAPRSSSPNKAENLRRFLNDQLTINCVSQESAGIETEEVKTEPKTKSVASQFKLRIRNTQNELQYDQGTPEFNKAGGAKLSIARDILAGQTEYYAKGVVGIDTGEVFIGDNTLRMTPYLTGERKFKTDKGTQGDIDKAGAGVIAQYYYSPLSSPLHFTASIDPQFLTDSVGNTRIWGGNFRFEPAFILPNSSNTFPGGPRQLGLIYYDLDVNFLGRYSHVTDNGGRPELALSTNYLYGGPELKLDLFGVPGTIFDRFILSSSYHHLYRFSGQHSWIEMFTTELKYTLDEAGLFQISIGYENGRDVEQFDKRKGWTTTLSYKF